MNKIIETSLGWCTITEENGEQVITPLDKDRVYQIKKETLNRRSVLQNSSLHKYYSLVANALLNKESTASLKSDEVTKVYEVMNRYLGEKLGLESIDFPSQESMCRQQNKELYERGRWFIQVLANTITKAEIQGNVKCVAVDAGVRTFATCYSEDEVVEFGESFAKDRLLPLALKYRKLLSFRQKLLNLKSDAQWVLDRLASVNKKLWKLENKKQDIVKDMHHQLAYYLVSNYDVIFLPTFKTKSMTFKKNRKINRTTTRAMLDLSHYKFKLLIKWYAKKYGKHVVNCNESYTTKTRSWDGTIDAKIGSKKLIKDEKFVVGRDINASRGILIKQLSMVA